MTTHPIDVVSSGVGGQLTRMYGTGGVAGHELGDQGPWRVLYTNSSRDLKIPPLRRGMMPADW
jgi:hypothetical protein